jgi:hypothetical protein
MASIELGPLSRHLEDEEIRQVNAVLDEADIHPGEPTDDSDGTVLGRDLDDDLFVDFLDRLEANDASCDLYAAAEFDETLRGAGYVIGSSHALLMVLEELRDEFFESEDEEEEAEDDGDYDYEDDLDDEYGGSADAGPVHIKDEHLRQMWKIMYRGARESIKTGLFLFVVR